MLRGGLFMSWQVYTAIGAQVETSVNVAVITTGATAWWLQLGSVVI